MNEIFAPTNYVVSLNKNVIQSHNFPLYTYWGEVVQNIFQKLVYFQADIYQKMTQMIHWNTFWWLEPLWFLVVGDICNHAYVKAQYKWAQQLSLNLFFRLRDCDYI